MADMLAATDAAVQLHIKQGTRPIEFQCGLTMSSNDSMGGAGLPSASSTTTFSRFRVSCRCSSLSA